MISINENSNLVIINHVSVKTAATSSGYSIQYIRRLLRNGRLTGLKVGQVWLIVIEFINEHLNHALKSMVQRFRPKLIT